MKKAIRFILMAVVLVIMAASCKKSSIISGRWELVHVHVYDDNNYAQPIETWRPADQGMRTYYEFLSSGVLLRTEVSNLGYGVTESRGTWNVDGDILIITFAAGRTVYTIDTANLTDLILFYDYSELGKRYHEVTTFTRASSSDL